MVKLVPGYMTARAGLPDCGGGLGASLVNDCQEPRIFDGEVAVS